MKVSKAIITAAGYGTRFLPATKNVPKELLPIINKPSIHYIVEQLVKAGIKDIIIVTRFGNTALEDYFDTAPALETYLTEKGKFKELDEIKEIYKMANFIFIRQDPTLPYGNAAPLYSAKNLIREDEPFLYSFGDDIIWGKNVIDAGPSEVIKKYNDTEADIVINCTEVSDELIPRMGILKFKEGTNDQVDEIIEKPKLKDAPSNIGSFSPYLFTPKLFEYLDPAKILPGKEFLMQDAMNIICMKGKVVASKTQGMYLTIGDPLNYLKATVEIALSRDDLKKDFLKYLKERIK